MATPAQVEVGTRIVAALRNAPGTHVFLNTQDGLTVDVTVHRNCGVNGTSENRFHVTASVPTTTLNQNMGVTSALLSQGYWERSTTCSCGDEDCDEHVTNTLETHQPLFSADVSGKDAADAAGKMYHTLMRVVNMKACSCQNFFIVDGGQTCFDCALRTAIEPESRASRGPCCICYEPVVTSDATSCCKQVMHAACMDKALERSSTCPMCRAPGAKRMRGAA
jgi:hypothetical protein